MTGRPQADPVQPRPPCRRVLFSPSHHDLNARDLADWVVADNLPVRLQLQLHKYLWNDEPGR